MRLERHAVVALASVVALCACPNKPEAQDDRLLQKLKEEQARLDKGAASPRPPVDALAEAVDPNEKLAQLATGGGAAEGKRKLPAGNATVHAGTVALKLAALTTSHSASGTGRLSLTTPDLFLKVSLAAQNVGTAAARLDFSTARLKQNGRDFPLARDAQRAAGTRELQQDFPVSERRDLVLLFEVPADALNPGLTLVLPATIGGAPDVEVPLE